MLTAAEAAIPLRSMETPEEIALRRVLWLVADATRDAGSGLVTTVLACIAGVWWVGARVVECELLGLGLGADVWGSIIALAKYDPSGYQTLHAERTMINDPATTHLAGAPCDGRMTTPGDLLALIPRTHDAARCVVIDGAHMDPRILRWLVMRLGLQHGIDQPLIVRTIPAAHASSVRLVPWLLIAAPDDAWRVCIAAEHAPENCP